MQVLCWAYLWVCCLVGCTVSFWNFCEVFCFSRFSCHVFISNSTANFKLFFFLIFALQKKILLLNSLATQLQILSFLFLFLFLIFALQKKILLLNSGDRPWFALKGFVRVNINKTWISIWTTKDGLTAWPLYTYFTCYVAL